MTFQDARDLAIEFGAKLPRFDHTSPSAQCWIDRIAYLPRAADREQRYPGGGCLDGAITEANRYA